MDRVVADQNGRRQFGLEPRVHDFHLEERLCLGLATARDELVDALVLIWFTQMKSHDLIQTDRRLLVRFTSKLKFLAHRSTQGDWNELKLRHA